MYHSVSGGCSETSAVVGEMALGNLRAFPNTW